MPDCGHRIQSEEYADFIVDVNSFVPNAEERYDMCYNIVFSEVAVIYAKISTFESNLFQMYGYSIFPHCYGLMDVNSIDASGLTRLRGIPALNLKGNGTLIAIIDTGIDYTHEAFRHADGTTRIISIWDQTIENGTPSPQGFYYGAEYSQNDINAALASPDPLSIVPSVDDLGHGTALAGIAGGNPKLSNNFSGIAYEANFIIVKLKQAKQFLRDYFLIPQGSVCYSESDILFGLKYVFELSRRLSMPISICMGLGTSQGSHDSRGALNTYINLLSDIRGISISVAAGNEGTYGHHFMGNISQAREFVTVDLRVGIQNTGFSMELWGTKPSLFSIDILSPTGEYIPPIPARLGESREINFVFEKTKIYVDYELIESSTGDQLILMRFQNPQEGIWRFRVYSSNNLPATFHMLLPIQNFLDGETYFTEADAYVTLTSPANAWLPIVATAYNPANESRYINASSGFTRTNMKNPTITVPGVNLVAPAFNNSYSLVTGTSISAAFAAGIASLILEWSDRLPNRPAFNTIEIKSVMILGAKRDPQVVYPNQSWGFGILDVYNSFLTLRGL